MRRSSGTGGESDFSGESSRMEPWDRQTARLQFFLIHAPLTQFFGFLPIDLLTTFGLISHLELGHYLSNCLIGTLQMASYGLLGQPEEGRVSVTPNA